MTEQRYCKRLIEVDLPIKRISEHARREKSIRHGHISTLHIWWARRPLAACRAVLCAALWPDPADSLCPERFKKQASIIMREFRDRRGGKPRNWNDSIELRKALLDFIADFADWDNSTSTDYLNTSRSLTTTAHESLGHGKSKPLVLDSFAGGGAIPLEALRIGADAFSSDLNPIAVFLEKVLIEYLPESGERLVEDFKRIASTIKSESENELSRFYPHYGNKIPFVYFWAKTVRCEGPNCGAQIPLLGTLWLSKRKGSSRAYKFLIRNKQIDVEILKNPTSKDVAEGTIRRSNAVCPICNYVTSRANVEKQIINRKGGSKDSRLMCVLWYDPSTNSRDFLVSREEDIKAYNLAKDYLRKKTDSHKGKYSFIPNEPLPYLRSIFNVHIYGVKEWGDLFSDRQALLLGTISQKINEFASAKENTPYKESIIALLMCVFGRMIDQQTTLVAWASTINAVTHTFGRQALGMIWDYVEPNLFANGGGSWDGAVNWVSRVVEHIKSSHLNKGNVQMVSAAEHCLPDNSADAFITDPPYYDAVPYADLSDFFYVWHKRASDSCFDQLFNSNLTPKEGEAVQLSERNEIYSYKTREYYEALMTRSFSEGRRIVKPDGIGTVVFAHKTTEGWEALLSSLIKAGWKITASWPIDTERPVRLRSLNSAALASSIHLVCRPREHSDGTLVENYVGDWRDVLQELPKKIHDWMPRLAEEGTVGADAIFACLGPALEIFSKYSHVEKADGKKVELGEYLEQVWAAVAKEALDMIFEGARTEGFEEDARLTAMWLWTLFAGANENGKKFADESEETADESEAGGGKSSLSGFSLEYDAARKIAQGLGAHLENLNTLVQIEGEQARLLSVAERVKILFGKDSSTTATYKRKKKDNQMTLFPELDELKENEWSLGDNKASLGKTILDRLHQAMILFGAGRAEALRRFLVEEGVGKDDRFWRLAQALSALYPTNTDEKRWIDGVLARKKSLGF